MDREGYRELLRLRKVSDEKIEAAIAMVERFESYLVSKGGVANAAIAWEFCNILIQEGQNTFDNLLALGRYGLFIKNNALYVAILELLDGAEVQPNLYQKVGLTFGTELREEVFAGIGISQLGLPPTEKPFDMFPVIDRLERKVGKEKTKDLLTACLRDLPDEHFLEERDKYLQAGSIDEYLVVKHQALVEWLRKCQQNGDLFYAQEITDDVLRYVEEHPETESGVRKGKVLYITKIPYNTKEYLTATDPVLKRYYACHCPWAREAIKSGNLRLNPIFCNCSGGYSKKPWEVIFGQPLKVEVLESALLGDYRCRFAVHLPDEL